MPDTKNPQKRVIPRRLSVRSDNVLFMMVPRHTKGVKTGEFNIYLVSMKLEDIKELFTSSSVNN